ncbi:MAG: ABC transporter ATP-binding protein [Bacteriovorax sp.]|jgi:energy-coupling factor transport system ATP-binding protein
MFKIGPFQYSFKPNAQVSDAIGPKKIFVKDPFDIVANKLIVISGPSGAGKSTFLQLVKGIIPEYSTGVFEGEILYKNQPLNGEYFQKNLKSILFLFQNPFSQLIFPEAAEEFFFSMENYNFSREQMEQKKSELSKMFNLENLWDKKTIDLSNGECQRLVLASLMAVDPEVLLLDEPTAFLDSEARSDFYQWLKTIKGSKTIIIVDHHLSEILPIADAVINVSHEGEIKLGTTAFFPELIQLNFPNFNVTSPMIELIVDGLKFHYENQRYLLEEVSLKAVSGDIVIIKGKNGQGKSTLFKIMAGLLQPVDGKVQIYKNNKEIQRKKHFKEIGFLFQNPEAHFFYDTIHEELKQSSGRFELHVLQEMFFSGIDLNRSPFLLSEGEKRRLSLLMTVFMDKSILFYDEPTFGQDQQSISVIKDMINYLKSFGKIQIIISHDDHFISAFSDKVYELKDGCLRRQESF